MTRLVEQSAEPAPPIAPLCRALDVSRASVYRDRRPRPDSHERPARKPSRRALKPEERRNVLETLNSPHFADRAPGAVYSALLDAGRYLCSKSTMYRILRENDQVRERRNQLRHPAYKKPELLATGPNQVWSWDITKLKGQEKWTYYQLYVILDIYSRYVVGWMVADREHAQLAEQLIRDTIEKQQVDPTGLTIHADRGAAMRSKTVALLLSDLGATKTHSRPHTSNDNPFSESQFKTMKYRPDFPARFGSLQDARAFCRGFFEWYNTEHYHGGIAMLTPETVHYGQSHLALEARSQVLQMAFAAHPERFVRGVPQAAALPEAVWINPPATASTATSTSLNNPEGEVSQKD